MGTRRRSGDPATRQRWRELVERWQTSRQTVREFCRSAGVKESAFYWWKRRLGGRQVVRGLGCEVQTHRQSKRTDEMTGAALPVLGRAAGFLPVQVVMDQATGSGVEIHWDNGRTVWLRRGFDRQTLADVLAMLEVRPC